MAKGAVDFRMRVIVAKTYMRCRRNTPRRFTGETKRAWVMRRNSTANYSVVNTRRVMRFLEKGTRAHGPKKAPRMFVPLNQKAFWAYKLGSKKKLVLGKDFVLRKRVKGIRPHKIIETNTKIAQKEVAAAMVKHAKHLKTFTK